MTSTNVVIQPIHNPQAEAWNVSLQRVSTCSDNLASSTPWLGHGWHTKKRQDIKKTVQLHGGGATTTSQVILAVVKNVATRCGWKIKRPVRYCQITVPQGPVQLDEGSCEVTREEDHVREKKKAYE